MKTKTFFLLPLLFLIGFLLLFAFRLSQGDTKALFPSTLISQPAPALPETPLPQTRPEDPVIPGLSPKLFGKTPVLVNFFASWCLPCREENPLFMAMKAKGVTILGVNYKDRPEDARAFLRRYRNPFQAVGVDPQGRFAIEWGVYGVPETFLIGADGRIVYKNIGPVPVDFYEKKVRPLLKETP